MGIDMESATSLVRPRRIEPRAVFAAAALAVALVAALMSAPAVAVPETPPQAVDTETPAVVITGLRLDPASPGPNTLCRLWVTLRNDGPHTVSWLHFRLRLNGQPIATYEGDVFMEPVSAGQEREIRLFNLWSSETGRPPGPEGRLEVELTLEAATWVDITTPDVGAEGPGGEEVWTPLGVVPGLPSSLHRVFGGKE